MSALKTRIADDFRWLNYVDFFFFYAALIKHFILYPEIKIAGEVEHVGEVPHHDKGACLLTHVDNVHDYVDPKIHVNTLVKRERYHERNEL